MKTPFALLTFGSLALAGTAFANEVHGPICSWHLDPTSTMNIQWIEEVEASVAQDTWLEGKAGFGYGDGDDATALDMQNKSSVLYIRKEFNIRALPSVPPMALFGNWNAEVDLGGDKFVAHKLSFTFGQNRQTAGSVAVGDQAAVKMHSFDVQGNTVHFEYDLPIEGKSERLQADAIQQDDGSLLGKWETLNSEGKVLATGEWWAEQERTRGGGGGRGGFGRGGNQEPNVKLRLKVRYDDGFIAYLNGVEIARANVATGSGSMARGISGHDADKEETFEITDDRLLNLLQLGRNVIAIEGHNSALDSSDFSLDPWFGFEAFGRQQSYVDRGKDWQFYLGKAPQRDWMTAEIAASSWSPVPENASTYVLNYGPRGSDLNERFQAKRRLFADTGNVIHQALLTGLQPDTAYGFEMTKAGETARSRRYFFKTAPARADKPITFVEGGDMYDERSALDAMNAHAGSLEPLFALLGGDLAYANGKDANRWYSWVDSWAQNALTPEDYCLPMIAVIGNHEVDKNLDEVTDRSERAAFNPLQRAKFYYSLFPLPEGKSNFVVDFGKYMSIVCLDSYHTQTPESQQEWLEATLRSRSSVPNLFAVYHRPAYGTLVKEDVMDIRKYWSPLFEKYGVDVVFENDHHMYKRTLPMRGGVMHPDGVAYIGDGAWGVKVREIPWEKTRNLKYIVRGESVNHLIRVILAETYQEFDAIDVSGKPIDNYVRVR